MTFDKTTCQLIFVQQNHFATDDKVESKFEFDSKSDEDQEDLIQNSRLEDILFLG